MANNYKAHKNDQTGEIQSVKVHSENTADLCRWFSVPVLRDFMYVMGLIHDVGKFQPSFQKRMDGYNIWVEHSTCGALLAKELYPNAIGLMMEYCIAGHHSGIQDGGYLNDTPDIPTLHGRLGRNFEDFSAYREELELPSIKQEEVLRFLALDCEGDPERLIDKFAFLTRYAFSCLVDADSIDTTQFCGREQVKTLQADFAACLEKVNRRINSFSCTTTLQKSRAILQRQVFNKVDLDGEIFLMDMPTGAGKTLCSVKFALERAIMKGKKRIIYVIPYNSIVDQTAFIFEELFGEDAQILRHQSTFSYDGDCTEDYRKAVRSASDNWDVASIIVTTSVQFFESVYANTRGKLRKLHNMSDSILIFDEAHLMPKDYLQPCLRAVAYITRYLNSEAVFLTATMPDFRGLLQKYALSGSKIVDLVDDTSCFFAFQKCRYRMIGKIAGEALVEKAGSYPSSLIIVNTKKSAKALYTLVEGNKYYLSTYMTAFDRERVIRGIQEQLKRLEVDYPDYRDVPEDRKIIIISTSLIEAGIDLDMYTVFRELSGLDSILQAGGRCNREGKRVGAEVFVFDLDDANGCQDVKSNLSVGMLNKYDDITSQDCLQEYYNGLFQIEQKRISGRTITKDCSSLSDIPFSSYAQRFELIDSAIVSLVVPRDKKSREIVNNLKYGDGSIEIARSLQKYSCSIYRWELDKLIQEHAVTDFGTGIYCLTSPDCYDENTGIITDFYVG